MGITTNFKLNGTDIGDILVPKSYLLDQYPELADNLKQAGLWVWGSNTYGKLGNNNSAVTSVSSPIQTISSGTNWKEVSHGSGHVAAIKTDGTLWTWGLNYRGELGDNTSGTSSYKSSPVQTITGGNNWKQVACGGTPYTTTIHNNSSGVQVSEPVGGFTAAIKTDGTLWLWGANHSGQLGNNNSSSFYENNYSSPVQTTTGGTTWKQVACGFEHTASIKTDGTLWIWGENTNGQLGIGVSAGSKSTPVQIAGGGTNWKQVSCGNLHTAAIKTDGTLWAWGDNNNSQLGDGTAVAKYTPIQVGLSTEWKYVSCAYQSVYAIKTNGTLWAWGNNNYGQLGIGDTLQTSTPVQIAGGGTNWKKVDAGTYHAAAIKTDGTLWIWGYATFGTLGDGISTFNKSTPIQISSGTNWKSVSCGSYVTGAIRDDSADPI